MEEMFYMFLSFFIFFLAAAHFHLGPRLHFA